MSIRAGMIGPARTSKFNLIIQTIFLRPGLCRSRLRIETKFFARKDSLCRPLLWEVPNDRAHLMAALRTRRTGLIQGWIAWVALALFASLSAHAQGRLQLPRAPLNQLSMALPFPGPNANTGNIKSYQVRSLAQGTSTKFAK